MSALDSGLQPRFAAAFAALQSAPAARAEAPPSTEGGRMTLVLRAYFVIFAIVGYLLPSHSMNTVVHVVQEIWWSVAFVIGGVGLAKYRSLAGSYVRASIPLAIVMALAVISTVWSDDPPATLRRSVELSGSALLALYFILRLGTKAFLETLGIAIGLLSFFSILFIIFLPDHGVVAGEYGDESWKGVFNHKNGLGQAMVLGLVTVGCTMDGARGLRRVIQIAALVVFAVLLAGSKSGTSLAIGAGLAVAAPILFWNRARHSRTVALAMWFGVFAVIGAGIMSDAGRDTVFNALGKDETLTGRTGLWRLVGDAIDERPVLGYGYKAFWLTDGGGGDMIRREETWEPTQAHNGFLEVALDLGMVGLFAVGVMLVHGLVRATAFFWRGNDLLSAWPLLFFIAFTATNIAEATMAKFYEIPWMVFVAALFVSVGRAYTDRGKPLPAAAPPPSAGAALPLGARMLR